MGEVKEAEGGEEKAPLQGDPDADPGLNSIEDVFQLVGNFGSPPPSSVSPMLMPIAECCCSPWQILTTVILSWLSVVTGSTAAPYGVLALL